MSLEEAKDLWICQWEYGVDIIQLHDLNRINEDLGNIGDQRVIFRFDGFFNR